MTKNLIEGIQEQQKRFHEVVIPAYESIGPSGQFALQCVIRPLLVLADVAIATGDVVAMVRVCKEMQDVKL